MITRSIRMTKGDYTGVLVALQHHLGITSDRVPELDAAIFGTTHDPVSIRSQTDAEHEVLFRGENFQVRYLTAYDEVLIQLTLWPSKVRTHLLALIPLLE